jgi:hypothetical protein
MDTMRWSRGVCLTALAALVSLATLVGCSQPDNSITSVEAAQNAKIGVMTGTTGEAIATLRFPNAQVKSFDDVMDAVAAMKSGQLDAVITSYPTCVQVAKKNPEFSYLQEPLQNEETAIALKKGQRRFACRCEPHHRRTQGERLTGRHEGSAGSSRTCRLMRKKTYAACRQPARC